MNSYLFHYVLALWVTGVTTLSLGLFVLVKSRQLLANRLFVGFSFAIAWWAFFQGYLPLAPTLEIASVVARLEHVSVVFLSTLFLHFVFSLVEKPHPRWIRLNYGIACALLIMLLTPWLVSGVDTSRPERLPFMVEPGPLYPWMILWFMTQTTHGVYALFRAYRRATGTRRTQLKAMAWGALIGYFGGCGNYLYVFDWELPIFNPLGTYSVPLYAAITAYAILRHRFLDIRVVIARTALALGVYTVVLGIPIALASFGQAFLVRSFGNRWWVMPLLLYTGLAIIGPIVYYRLQKRADARLISHQRRYQRTIRAASRGLTRIKELTKLADLIVRIAHRFLRVQHATLFLWSAPHRHFEIVAAYGPQRLRAPLSVAREDPVVTWLTDHHTAYIAESTTPAATDRPMTSTLLRRLQTVVVVPSFSRGELVGFLCLGERLSREEYTRDDVDVLVTLADQAAVAVENARAYEALQHAKHRLVDQEKMAAIAHLASGMAHEIKNPLSTIRTFAEFLPEKYQDPAFREKFARLVTSEADRINAIVQQLLEFAKPVPPRLEPLDVHQVIDATLEWLSNDFLSANVHVDREYRADHAVILGDPNQLKQVLLNLCLNSLEAMKTENRPRRLTIQSERREADICVRLIDTGCGIPKEQLPKLFDPFFTTKERGTGLGLAVVQRIIEMHRGMIEIYSKVGQGTIIELNLPLALMMGETENVKLAVRSGA